MGSTDNPGSSSDSPSDRSRASVDPADRWAVGWLLWLGALGLYLACVFVPWGLTYPKGDLDLSWVMVLNWARGVGADFGREIVFTFGPWGFAMYGYAPHTHVAHVAAWGVLAAAFFAGAIHLSGRLPGRGWLR